MGNSEQHGKISSKCEIANISPFGVWVLVAGHEYFLDHKKYPWFRDASVEAVLDVECPRPGHLRWPVLDVDLHIDSVKHPGRYPLTAASKSRSKQKAPTHKLRGTRRA